MEVAIFVVVFSVIVGVVWYAAHGLVQLISDSAKLIDEREKRRG